MARPEDMLTRVRNDRVGVYTLVHCYDDADEAAGYGLWESVNWWYKHLAEFTLQWELPNLSEEEQKAVFPLLEPVIEGEVPVEHYQERGHDHRRDARGVPREDPPLRVGRRRPAALLRAVRRPAAREGDAERSSCWPRRSCRSSRRAVTESSATAASDGHDLRAPRRRPPSSSTAALHPDLVAAFSLDGRTAVVTGAGYGHRAPDRDHVRAGRRRASCSPTATRGGLAETRRAGRRGRRQGVVVPTDVTVKSQVDDLAREAVRAHRAHRRVGQRRRRHPQLRWSSTPPRRTSTPSSRSTSRASTGAAPPRAA